MIEVRSDDYGKVYTDIWEEEQNYRGFFVHEHLVRERSSMLEEMIDEQKKKGEERVVITIHAESVYVSSWIDCLYGQPMFSHCERDGDDVLERFIKMFGLARQNGDYHCANLCLDAIRNLFLEDEGDLDESLDKLKPLLDALDYHEYGKVLDMIIHMVVYRPAADPKQRKVLLMDIAEHYRRDKPANLWQQLGLAFATKEAAKALACPKNIPDFTAEHAYHLRKPAETLCCGRPCKKRPMIQDEEQ